MKFLWSRAVMAAAVLAFATSTIAVYAATPTPPGTPSRPSSLKAVAGDTRVTLTWTAPTVGKPISNYTVTWSPATGGGSFITTETNYVATPLNNGTLYTFKVTATNLIGVGPPSAPATATPHATPPGRPNNLGATHTAPGQIRLDWTPPTGNGSMPDGSTAEITRYNITVNPGGTKAVVPATTLTYTASGLADNVTYTFQVSATNTRPLTGAAATVYAPLPRGANIGLQPTAGLAKTAITVTGQLFLKNESITLYWDVSSHVAASVVTDGTGAFTKVVKPFAGDKPKVHKLCASVQPHPCASFTLRAPPSPTPGVTPSPVETPTPTPAQAPQASGVRPGGGISGLDIITRPPFVFLPIIGIIGILGVLAYFLLSRRRQLPPASSATVVHRATRPDYMAPFPTAGATRVVPQPPVQPSAWDSPVQSAPPVQPYVPPAAAPPPARFVPTPYVPPPVPPQAPPPPPASPAAPPRNVEWPGPQNPPAAPDEPPDLPQPSD